MPGTRPELLGTGQQDPSANYANCQPGAGDVSCTSPSFGPFRSKEGIATNQSDSAYYSAIYASRILLPALHTHVLLDHRSFYSRAGGIATLTYPQDVADAAARSALLSPDSAISLQETWLSASRVHEYLFHAALSVSSASMEALTQNSFGPISFYHRGLAIRMINDQLSDLTQHNADEVIAAIIALANIEVSQPL